MQYENLYRLEIEDIKGSKHHLISDKESAENLYYMLEQMLGIERHCKYCDC